MTLTHDIIAAIIGWAIPLLGAWAIAKIPTTRTWLETHREFTRVVANCILSVLISATAIFAYDRFFLAASNAETQAQLIRISNTLFAANPNLVEPVSGRCPVGTSIATIGTSVVSGGPHGLVESVNFKCGALQFQKP
jgi:hypothetical protein